MQAPLKIGFVFDDGIDRTDGVQQYVLGLGAWLTKQGHDVHYIVGETKRTDLPNIHSLSKNVGVTFNGNKMRIPLPVSKKKIQKLFAEHRFDVLHLQTPHSPFYGHKVIRAASPQTAVFATFHILPENRAARIGTRLLRIPLRASINRIDRMFAVSAAAKLFADTSFRVRSEVSPNTIDLKPFFSATPLAQSRKLTIVFLGRLVPRKGCKYLLEAISELVNTGYDKPFEVYICGKGEQRASLERYVQQQGLSDIVHFEGFISEEDKPRYLAMADIAVYPSTGGESFGIVLLEAMAASKGVVLAGDNPGYRSVIGVFPHQLFDPKNTKGLSRLMREYLDDATARKKTMIAQKQYVKDFDIDVVGRSIVAAYRDVLRNKQAS